MSVHGEVFVSHFTIRLNKPPVYFAGETVTGQVIIHVNHPIQTRGLFIQIKGDCNVFWTDKTMGYKAEPRHYRNKQQCLQWCHYFMGNPRTIVTLETGAHEFEFSYSLPKKIPSSFEGHHGNIRYFVMSQLDWPGGNHFQQTLQCITVNSIFDLNLSPDTKASEERKAEYNQVLFRRSLKTTLNVPRRGFVPGQTVTAFASVDNKMVYPVQMSKVELVEICKYQACGQERQTKRIVGVSKRGQIAKGTKDAWHVQLDIPPIPPSGLVYCPIIHLEYYIKLTVEASSTIPKQKLQIPLIIGSIPLKEDAAEFESENEDDISESLQGTFGKSAPSVQFAESVWGKTELSTNQRRVSQAGGSFTPNYVMYKRNSNSGGMSQKKKTARSISMPCPAEQNTIKEAMDLVINGTLELDLIDEKTEDSDRDSISTTNEQTSSDF